MERSANARKTTSPKVPAVLVGSGSDTDPQANIDDSLADWVQGKTSPALVHFDLGIAPCCERTETPPPHTFTTKHEEITCLDCRAALGLRIGPPDETSGVDLLKLERDHVEAANTAPPKKG